MTTDSCELEPAIVRAAAGNRLSAEQRAHLERCGNCREALRIAGWLAAADEEPAPRLPDPGCILARARWADLAGEAGSPRPVSPLIDAVSGGAAVLTAGIAVAAALGRSPGSLPGLSPAPGWVSTLLEQGNLVSSTALLVAAAALILWFADAVLVHD